MLDTNNMESLLPRPAYKSDYNYLKFETRAQVRYMLAYLFIRELPIKSFYARSFIMYFYVSWFMARMMGKGFRQAKPITVYSKDHHERPLLNYPDLFWWNKTRTLPSIPVKQDINVSWRMRQTPVFHQYHRCVYRYRYRKPRYIPWDGTQSQPVMPFHIDQGTGVINGTWKKNPNCAPQLK